MAMRLKVLIAMATHMTADSWPGVRCSAANSYKSRFAWESCLPVQAGRPGAADGFGQKVRDGRSSLTFVEASCQRHKIGVQVTPDVPGIFNARQQIGFVRERLEYQDLPRGPVTVQG